MQSITKNFLLSLAVIGFAQSAFAQGVLPSWMRRNEPIQETRPTVSTQRASSIPKLTAEVLASDMASNGEVTLTVRTAADSAAISSLTLNGFEMGGFSGSKSIKRVMPVGKSTLNVELTDEFGQKYTQALAFERAPQSGKAMPRLVAEVISSEMAPNGEVLLTVRTSSESAAISSMTVNGFEMGGFTGQTKSMKRFMPVGKTTLNIELTDEFGQKYSQALAFDRPAPTGVDAFAQQAPQISTDASKLMANLPPPTTKKVAALVIGNSNYVVSPLTNPKNDAIDVANKLEELGYKVRRVIDGDRRSMLKNLAAFRDEAEKADVGFVYYAGHGVQVGGVNYILPVDFNLESGMASIQFDGIAVNQMLENFVPTETKLAFLDACRDNPLARSLSKTRGGNASGLAAMDAVSGTLISFATKDGSVAQDGNGRNSPYTKALLAHLGDQVDVSVMLRRVRQKVIDETRGKQVPWDYGSLVGDELVLGGRKRTK